MPCTPLKSQILVCYRETEWRRATGAQEVLGAIWCACTAASASCSGMRACTSTPESTRLTFYSRDACQCARMLGGSRPRRFLQRQSKSRGPRAPPAPQALHAPGSLNHRLMRAGGQRRKSCAQRAHLPSAPKLLRLPQPRLPLLRNLGPNLHQLTRTRAREPWQAVFPCQSSVMC